MVSGVLGGAARVSRESPGRSDRKSVPNRLQTVSGVSKKDCFETPETVLRFQRLFFETVPDTFWTPGPEGLGSGRLIFIQLQCWEVMPFLTVQRQRCIEFRVLRALDFYTPLALNCQKRAAPPSTEVENNSDHTHPPYLQKICPENMPYNGGLYGTKVG